MTPVPQDPLPERSTMAPKPAEQVLVERLVPWWSKLVHRMVVAEEATGERQEKRGVEHVEDKRIAF